MNTPQKIHINASQAAVLTALRGQLNQPGVSCAAVQALSGLCRTMVARSMLGLREYELIVETVPHAFRKPGLWAISMAGQRALDDYKLKIMQAAIRAPVVKAPTFNTYGSSYTPSARVYYRNDGNQHIASAGVAC